MEPTDTDLVPWHNTVHAFMDDDIGIEYCRDAYQNRTYPHAIYDEVVDRDWIGIILPPEHGGEGRTHLEQSLLLEALGKYGYDFGVLVLVSMTSAESITQHASQIVIDRFIPKFLAGDIRFSVGITEPQTGSDAASLQTTAERTGDTYRINGEKTYQSAAGADGNVINAYVRTDDEGPKQAGISNILIPTDHDGVQTEELPLVARKAGGTYHVTFTDVEVPVTNRIGDEGAGWDILTTHLIHEHTLMAATMAGNAQTVVETAAHHTNRRERFGRHLTDFQAVSHTLADMDTDTTTAHLLTRRAARLLDTDTATRYDAAKAKLHAGEVLKRVATQGVQLLGGAGLHPDNDMERYWREGTSATIAGGTSEIQRSIIARELTRNT